jgi:hypothetical protein
MTRFDGSWRLVFDIELLAGGEVVVILPGYRLGGCGDHRSGNTA